MDLKTDSDQNFPEWPSESWIDPAEELAKLRLRLQKLRFGFAMMGLALVVATLSSLYFLIHILIQILFIQVIGPFPGKLGALLGIPHFELFEGAIITWGSLAGALLLWSRWPDVHWQRRSGILAMMCVLDAVFWTIRHAAELGLSDGEVGHDWFREALGTAVGWSEFALIVSLASDISAHLGQKQAVDLSRSVRSLATTGAIIWFMFFSSMTIWRPPIWPLRARMINDPMTFMLYLLYSLIWTICLVQSARLCLMSSRCCTKALIDLTKAEQASDLIPSRSEEGWADLNRKSGPNDRP